MTTLEDALLLDEFRGLLWYSTPEKRAVRVTEIIDRLVANAKQRRDDYIAQQEAVA